MYIVYQNLDSYRIPKAIFIFYTKTQIHTAYQNLYLYLILEPRVISHTKSKIYIVYQNLDLYRMPKARFISYIKTQIHLYTKTYIYIAYQNLDLNRIPKPIFIPYTKAQIYTVYQNLYMHVINFVTCGTGTPVSSTNKNDRHDIIKIMLKLTLNTITLTHLLSAKQKLPH